MADIFISYARKDLDRVRPIAEALRAHGWEVWWDLSSVRTGQSFNQAIQEALEQVKCVVVLWTETSVKSPWVESEAYWAWEHKKLASVTLDMGLRLPVPFNTTHSENLSSWSGDTSAPHFVKLVADLTAIARIPPVEEPRRESARQVEPERQAAREAYEGKAIGVVEAVSRSLKAVKQRLADKDKAKQAREGSTPKKTTPRLAMTTIAFLGGVVIAAVLATIILIHSEPAPGTILRDAFKDGGKGPEMVVIPAGSFLMGSPEGEGEGDERPQHKVTITKPFALGRYPLGRVGPTQPPDSPHSCSQTTPFPGLRRPISWPKCLL